jgi:hypothetical protein
MPEPRFSSPLPIAPEKPIDPGIGHLAIHDAVLSQPAFADKPELLQDPA